MANNRTLTFSFSEIPLIVDGPFEDNGVDGEAEINYWPDGTWSIASISIEVARAKTEDEKIATGAFSRIRKQHVLDAGSPLYLILYDRLENGKYTRRNIQDEVDSQIADAAENYANWRWTDEAKHHNVTLMDGVR
jgi:hypothetical protein